MKDLKEMYGVYLRSSIVVSLVVVISAFVFVPNIEVSPYTGNIISDSLLIEVFPPIDNPSRPQPLQPTRPQPPVGDSDVNADSVVITIKPTDINDHIPLPYTYNPIEIVPYYKVEVKPQPIYIPAPEYPELARRAGIEGKTVVKALVDVDGSIAEVKVLQTSGNTMLDQAALAAARKATFTPAKQRDKYVRVWVAIPINFSLTNG
jgi:protein TonB